MLTALRHRLTAAAAAGGMLAALLLAGVAADLGPYASQRAGADVCDEIIVVEPDGQGIFSEAGEIQCGPGSSAPGGGGPGSTCSYSVVSTVPTWLIELGGSLPGEPLPWLDIYLWYEQVCPDGSRALIAVPIGNVIIAGVVVSAFDMALWARDRLNLPNPNVAFNPDVDSPVGAATLVNLPTWWWVENWSSRQSRAEAGGVWAEVTATPIVSQWRGGDGGSPSLCNGPGLEWRRGLSESDSRACTYNYERSSAGAPGNKFSATASIVWRITWVGSGGAGGTLPDMTTSTIVPIGVIERHAIVTGGRG
ncbi:MAG: hypothetical protein L0Y54_21840 [Sporichthyaceae bacterium]|nr:hypothetical protein [Sporichthyaceae bacterium]